MHHAALVRGGETGAELPRELQRAVRGEAAEPAEEGGQLLAVDELHRQEGMTVDFVHVIHAADVRVRDLGGHAHLGVDLHQPGGVAVDVRGQELQRDGLPQLQVVGAIDLAHAAAAASFDDAVAAAEEGAGSKRP